MEYNAGFARPSVDDEKVPVFIFSNAFDYLHYKEVYRVHGFPFFQFLQCTGGSGTLWIYDKEYQIKKGDAFLLPKNVTHRYLPDCDDWLLDWIVFSGSCFDRIYENLELPEFAFYENGFSAEIHRMIQEVVKIYQKKPLNRVIQSSGRAYEILLKIKDLSTTEKPIARVVNYIHSNIEKEITLENLSEILGITPAHLCRIFKAEYHMRPFEYIRRERIQLAKQLLIQRDMNISEVAHSCGFINDNYFREAFKKETGVSPRIYRGRF